MFKPSAFVMSNKQAATVVAACLFVYMFVISAR